MMAPIDRTIKRMVDRIVEDFDPEQIVLFGSRARGDARPDSDVDLLVVVRGPVRKRELATLIYRALAGMGRPKDIIVVTTDEVERYRDVPGTIVYPALREGQLLYERQP